MSLYKSLAAIANTSSVSGSDGVCSQGVQYPTPYQHQLLSLGVLHNHVRNKTSIPSIPPWLTIRLTGFSSSVAPSFVAAACYMSFGRLVWWVTPSHHRGFKTLWVPARWITPLFVSFDLGSFFVQFIGLAVIASGFTSNKTGKDLQHSINNGIRVLKFGLIIQLLCFGIFALISARFIFISRRWRNEWLDGGNARWRRLGWAINVSSTLIMVGRSNSLYRR